MPACPKFASPTWEPTPPMSSTSHVWTAAMEAPDTGLWLTLLPPSSTTNQNWMWEKNQTTPSTLSFLSLRPGTWSSEHHPHLCQSYVKKQYINVCWRQFYCRHCFNVTVSFGLHGEGSWISSSRFIFQFITLIAGRSARLILRLT